MMVKLSENARTGAVTDLADDPILIAINEYRFGGDQYDELPGDMAEDEQEIEFDRLAGEPLARLENWSEPAHTLDGAMAALRLATAELELALHEENSLAKSMLRAALGFFEGIPSMAMPHARAAAHVGAGPAQ